MTDKQETNTTAADEAAAARHRDIYHRLANRLRDTHGLVEGCHIILLEQGMGADDPEAVMLAQLRDTLLEAQMRYETLRLPPAVAAAQEAPR